MTSIYGRIVERSALAAATSVSIDFDGLARSSAHPDIGAFVFHKSYLLNS